MKLTLHRCLPALALAALALAFPSCSTADSKDAKAGGATDFGQVASWVTHLLQEQHYTKHDFDDTMSKKALKNYIEYLDYDRMYFLKSEVDGFNDKYGTKLDDLVFSNDLTPAHEIYAVYSRHLKVRFEKV